MIKIKNLCKEYLIDHDVKFTALCGLNLNIKDGDFLAIVGPSGSGKSTLMHMIGLIDKPSSGEIIIDNKNVLNLGDDEISKLRNRFVGFIFQQFNLINKLTILENVLLPTIYATQPFEIDPKKKAMDLLTRFGMGEKINSYPNKISGGQQQRVAIARALIMDPQLILADEPTGNLDSKTGKIILDLLSELNHKDKKTVIIVTHDKEIAARTKRSITIMDGKIIDNSSQD